MSRRWILRPCVITLLLVCAASHGVADGPSDLPDRIRVHMRDYLAHLPDYTCRVTLERSRRPSSQARFELDDRLRLDVAYAGAQELYALPGDDRFESGIADLVSVHGMISDGSYALHTRKLFLSDAAIFRPPLEAVCAGEPCVQLDFAVPVSRSGYSLGGSGGSAPVALAGSVWFDRDSLDIRRLLVRVDDPPPTVRIAATREETVYGRVGFGDRVAVLPRSSELLLTDRNGSQSLNRSTFQQCHQYAGMATISYGAGEVVPVPAAQSLIVSLPAGLELEMALDERIGPEPAAGDLFTATLTRPGIQRGTTVPAGARVTGRLTRMERSEGSWVLGLSLLKVEWAGNLGTVRARLRRAPGMKSPRDTVWVKGRDPVLAAGMAMTWRLE